MPTNLGILLIHLLCLSLSKLFTFFRQRRIGHFTLLFCGGRQRNVHWFITHVHRLNLLFSYVVVTVAVVVILVPSTLIRFQTKTELFCSAFKSDLRPHLSVLKMLLYPQCACSNELDACAFQHIGPRNLDTQVGWSGARRHRFQIASFSPSTLENSVFKKLRFQIAPLCRTFSNGSVFGDRFQHCSVDDSSIHTNAFSNENGAVFKTAPFSFENGLVWTGP